VVKSWIPENLNGVSIEVVIEKINQTEISCLLQGAIVKESLLFINYHEEIIAAVENPRYIISQAGWFRIY